MNFLRNRMAFLFFLALVITSGCRIIPWFGDYPSDKESFVGELILSRNIDATQAFNFNTSGFRLSIPAGALRSDSKIEITRYPLLKTDQNLAKEYKPISALYSINVLPAITTLSQPATLKFTVSQPDSGKARLAAYRDSTGEWKFASPLPQESSTEIVVETLRFSDWMAVENTEVFTGSLSQGMTITASPSAAIASTTGFFEENVEVGVCLKSNQPLNLSPANSQLKMQLSTYGAFSLDITDPDAPTGGRTYTSDSEDRVMIDLLNTSLAKVVASGNNATYTFLLKLKGKTPEQLPSFLAMNSVYTSETGIDYSAVETLTFSKAPAVDENESLSPRISDTLPANGADFVASSTEIKVVFDSKMNLESVQNALKVADRAGNTISGSFSWQDDRAMTFKPDQPLLPSTEYVMIFSDGALGQNGLALITDGEIVFTTASNDPAELVSFSPANNAVAVAFNAPVVLRFSQPMDAANLKFTVTPTIPGDFTATWNDNKTEVSILYGSGYASNQPYRFDILSTTLDIYGKAIKEAYTFSFTSEAYVGGRLVGISPASGSIDIAPNSAFVFTFDNAMNTAAVDAAISFSPALTGAVYTWSEDSTKLTVTYAGTLQAGTEYRVTVARSDANQLLTSYVISYRVVAALQVTGSLPTNNAAGLATTQAVEIRFNNPVNTGTLAISFDPAPANGFDTTWSDGNKTLLLTPVEPGLQESLSYQITVLAATADVYGNSLSQNYILGFSTGAFTQPAIQATEPQNNATSVAPDTQIAIYFNKSMDKAETEAALTIQPSVTPVFSWQDTNKTLLINFSTPLTTGTAYQLTLGTDAADNTGLKLAVPYIFAFTTAAPASSDPTTLVYYQPADNADAVETFAPVLLRFSAPINQSTLDFTVEPAVAGGYTTSWNDAGTEATINFNSGFASGVNYSFTVLDTTRDIFGDSISTPAEITFTAATYEKARIISISPASGSSDITPDTVFELTFDRAMNLASVESAIGITPAIENSFQWLDGNTRLRIDPSARLNYSTTYLLNIPATARAADNLELITSYQISWKTAAQLQVSETTPENNAANLPLSQTIEIRFNNPVNTETLDVSFDPAPANGFETAWSDGNKTLLLTPVAPGLQESLSYQVTVLAATTDIYGSAMSQNYTFSFSTGAFTQPEIQATQPANNATSVAADSQIAIYFSKSMDRDKTQAALTIQPAIVPVFSWQDTDKTLLINFADPMAADTEYQLTFSTETTDKTGLKLAAPYSFAFITAAASSDPTTLVYYEPAADNADAVEPFAPVLLRFSAPINKSTLAFAIEPAIAGDYTTSWNDTGTEATIKFNSGFASGVTYSFTVLATTKDIFGANIIAPAAISFTAATYTKARISTISPASGSSDIATGTNFEITFDRAMNVASVETALSITPAIEKTFQWLDGDTRLRVVPSASLAYATTYLLSLPAAAKAADNLELVADYQISWKTAAQLQVSETIPENDAANLPLSQAVEIRFNNPVNTETLAVSFEPAPVNGFDTTWSDGNRTLLLTPVAPGLQESLSYQIAVLTGTTDIYGNALPRNYTFSFSTGAFTQPEIQATQPENNATSVAADSQIAIYFSKSMDRTKTQAALTIQPAGTPVFAWQDTDKTLLVNFADPMTADTEYQLTFSTETTDKTGLKLAAPYSFAFTTAAPPTPDPTTLVYYEPADNAVAVEPFAPILLRFSAPISKSTLAFAIEPAVAGGYTTIWNDTGTEATISFASGFASGINYSFRVLDTTRDIYGNAIIAPAAVSFTAATYTKPGVITINPASGSSNITPDSVFELTFDRAMNVASVESAISITPAIEKSFQWLDANTRLRIVPSARLGHATTYLLNIPATVRAADNLEMVNSYQISWKTAAQLQISETVPVNNAANLTLRPTVDIRFNNSVNPSSLVLSWLPSPGSFSQTWSENNTLLTLVPAADLLESQKYLITVGEATTDIYSTNLGSDYVLSFTTGAVTPPAVSSTQPVAGSLDVPVSQQVKIVFSKAMDTAKTQAAVSVSPSLTPAFSWENSDTTMVIGMGAALSYDTSYQITIGTGATDKSGLTMTQSYLLGFKTVTRPTVLTAKCYPAAGATGIPPQSVIKIEFSKAMNKESAQTAFSLKQSSTAVSGNFSWSGNIMSFTPATSLAYGQTYQISIAETALDSLGNSLAAAVSWNFVTAADEGKIWTLEQANTEATTTFSQRSEHVMIGFNDKLWVIGGFDGIDYLNDVWSSSDGKSWTRETAAASFGARSGHACVVYDGKIWLTGGYSEVSGLFDDVWNSSDGRNWIRVNSSADYYARHGHTMALFANKIWVIGGEGVNISGTPILLDDCWSSGDGLSWQQNSGIVAFFPRKLHASGVINSRLWVWGGYGEDSDSNIGALNDVWSTADGEFWRLESSAAAFPARCAAAAAFFNNRIWLTGGASDDPYRAGANYYNDIWVSADGKTWQQILGNSAGSATQFSPRVLHGAATAGDKLFVGGGELASYYLNNEVWSTK